MRVLGIDPGTVRMGFGILDAEEELQMVCSGVLTAQEKSPLPSRLHQLHIQLLDLLKIWQPSIVAVEDPFVARNPRSALAIGQAQAVAFVAAAQYGLPVFTYSPRQIKQAVTDYGGGSKEQVQEMVRIHLDLDSLPEPLDASDALAVAICHVHHSHEKILIERSEEGVL